MTKKKVHGVGAITLERVRAITAERLRDVKRKAKAYVKSVREWMMPFDGWPRDARAWARRERIEALRAAIETTSGAAPEQDHAAQLQELIMELEEWVRRERAFLRGYPTPDPPSRWTRRDVSPSARPQDSSGVDGVRFLATATRGGLLKAKAPRLTIGMPTYRDYDGAYFTLQALRLCQDLAQHRTAGRRQLRVRRDPALHNCESRLA